jgi:hypothetical protein
MKIVVQVAVELDPEEWTKTFGVKGSAAIRADVKSYVGNEVQHAGVFGDGEVSAEIDWK